MFSKKNQNKDLLTFFTFIQISTRMHSSRMRTARLLPVSPSMHCLGVGGYLPGGEVPGPRGMYLPRGVYLLPGEGVYLPGGVPGPGGCTWSWGVYLAGGVYLARLGVLGQGVYLPGGVPAGGAPAQSLPPHGQNS